jgi:hypothetical protein
MTSKTPEPIRKSFGEVTVKEAQGLRLGPPRTARTLRIPRLQYTWLPPPALQDQLPSKFELSLQCVRDSDGVRRFYPWDRFEMFLALASTGGLAILCQRQNLSPQKRHSYRSMRLLVLRVHHMEEHFSQHSPPAPLAAEPGRGCVALLQDGFRVNGRRSFRSSARWCRPFWPP